MADRGPHRRTRSHTFRRMRMLVIGVIFVIVGGGIGAIAIVQTVGARAWGVVPLGIVLVLVSVGAGYRVMQTGVVVRADGLKIRNVWNSRTIGWAELAGVSPASASPSRYVRIMLRNGGAIQCDALSPSAFGGTRGLDRIARRLQGAIEQVHSA